MTHTRYALLGLSALALSATSACDGCANKKTDGAPVTTSSEKTPLPPPPSGSASPQVVAEALPRCRVDGARLPLPGEDVVAGDGVTSADSLYLGVVRRDGGRRVGSILRASPDLATVKAIDVGVSLGEDPPPSPRLHGGTVLVASYARGKSASDAGAGAMTRTLEISRIDGTSLVRQGAITQQADESLAFDIAWPSGPDSPPLVAWDEDAPLAPAQLLADRGVVKVQVLGSTKARVASADTTDAEAPRLLAKKGGYWLAWLAKKPEATEDAGLAQEAPGERRAYRWVELVALDAKGDPTSPVRRITPEKGRVASFDLALAAADGNAEPRLVLLVQDEAAHAEGAGERIVRYVLDGAKDRFESGDLLDGGVGHALADLLATPDDARAAGRWLAFTDMQERAHVVPLGASLALGGSPTLEPSLDGARIVAPGIAPEVVYAVGTSGGSDAGGGRAELRRLVCR